VVAHEREERRVCLTMVPQPLAESGERGVARLLDLIAGQERDQVREVLPVSLVIRRTTAALSGG
jgi:DNA-binding LacI/PurR family transcriptional regulator